MQHLPWMVLRLLQNHLDKPQLISAVFLTFLGFNQASSRLLIAYSSSLALFDQHSTSLHC